MVRESVVESRSDEEGRLAIATTAGTHATHTPDPGIRGYRLAPLQHPA